MFTKLILRALFYFFFIAVCKLSFASEGAVKIYSTTPQNSKIIFNIVELTSSSLGVPVSINFTNSNDIISKIQNGDVDLIITEDYQTIKSLKDMGLINFTNLSEIFFEKLVFIRIKSEDTQDGLQKKEAIFFKTSENDKDVIDNLAKKVPSVLISSSVNLCKKIDTMKLLYEQDYEYIIIKESVAKKCEFYYSGFFDSLYTVYYVGVVLNKNFTKSQSIFQFIDKSPAVKKMIKESGYSR